MKFYISMHMIHMIVMQWVLMSHANCQATCYARKGPPVHPYTTSLAGLREVCHCGAGTGDNCVAAYWHDPSSKRLKMSPSEKKLLNSTQ